LPTFREATVTELLGTRDGITRVRLDNRYIENWSLLFDIKILVRTFLNAFRGDRNAY